MSVSDTEDDETQKVRDGDPFASRSEETRRRCEKPQGDFQWDEVTSG